MVERKGQSAQAQCGPLKICFSSQGDPLWGPPEQFLLPHQQFVPHNFRGVLAEPDTLRGALVRLVHCDRSDARVW